MRLLTKQSRILTVLTGVLASVSAIKTAPATAQQGQPPYAIVDVGTFGGKGATARGINNIGEVTGAATWNVQQGRDSAYVWRNGEMRALFCFGWGCEGEGWHINELGHAAGENSEVREAALWRDGEQIDLGTLGGEDSRAWDLNDLDQVVGQAEFEPGGATIHAFLWDQGVLTDLNPGDSPSSTAYAINNAGQIVGVARFPPEYGDKRPTLWKGGVAIDLGTLGGRFGLAFDINENGVIVGESQIASMTATHAFVLESGVMRDVHSDSDFRSSTIEAVNNFGEMIGRYTINCCSGPEDYPAYWPNPDSASVPLGDLLPPHSRWSSENMFPSDINDHGQIVGFGWHFVPEFGEWIDRGFLITPVEHEFALSDVAPGIAGQVNGMRASGLEPGERVYFLYSQRGGGTVLPMCEILDATLQLDYPQVITSVRADANGEALLLVDVPAAARARGDILIQAVVPSSCKLSELRVVRFE